MNRFYGSMGYVAMTVAMRFVAEDKVDILKSGPDREAMALVNAENQTIVIGGSKEI
jgi:hypothetical protein